jgi:hypothetical protein
MSRPANLLSPSNLAQPKQVPRRLPCLGAFRPRLLARARAQIGPRLRGQVDPADIVHETLLKAHRARDQFSGDNERQLSAWLYYILIKSINNPMLSPGVMAPGG